jgi:hypothetical protein
MPAGIEEMLVRLIGCDEFTRIAFWSHRTGARSIPGKNKSYSSAMATSPDFVLGGLAYALGGWNLASWIGFALPMLAIAFFLLGWIRARAHANA